MKNVKGFIGLFTGIAAFILIGLALFLPTYKIAGTSIALHGTTNIIMAIVAGVLGIIAIVFGIMSKKDRDKKGPRKAGVIIGIFAIIISLISAGVCALTKTLVDYANGVPNSAFSQLDDESRKSIDKALDDIRAQYPEK